MATPHTTPSWGDLAQRTTVDVARNTAATILVLRIILRGLAQNGHRIPGAPNAIFAGAVFAVAVLSAIPLGARLYRKAEENLWSKTERRQCAASLAAYMATLSFVIGFFAYSYGGKSRFVTKFIQNLAAPGIHGKLIVFGAIVVAYLLGLAWWLKEVRRANTEDQADALESSTSCSTALSLLPVARERTFSNASTASTVYPNSRKGSVAFSDSGQSQDGGNELLTVATQMDPVAVP